jgi:hypothetical protein
MLIDGKEAADFVIDKLRFHNQFALGPYFLEKMVSWNCTAIDGTIFLSSHPDLNVIQTTLNDKSLTLIGFILDPYNPSANDADIVNGLIRDYSDFDHFIDLTKRFGGRWIIIAENSQGIKLFTDPAGLRQIFYTDTRKTGELWCASQPGMIADILNLRMCKEGIDYINTYEFRKNQEFWWPGVTTPYEEVMHLLPNHFLDLTNGSCKRYWPSQSLENTPLTSSIDKCSSLLQGLLKSASHRFELAFAITAGLDSRVVLAASKDLNNVFSYMTVRQIGMAENHADIEIPSRLLSKIGLSHDVVRSSLIIDDGFVDIFRNNTALAHPVYAPDACAILKYYSGKSVKQFVVVTGSASEIARSSFRAQLNKPVCEAITPSDLASLHSMGKSSYVLKAFERWISGIENIHGYDILDIFEWEQGHGNWLAMCQLEFDIAWKDLFTPFNCRELLETMLSVDYKYRKAPDYALFHAIISNLWPELLDIPINPHKNNDSASRENMTGIGKLRDFIPASVKKPLKYIYSIFVKRLIVY